MFTIFLCVKVLICLLSPGGPVLNLGANQLACHRRLILPLVLKCRLSLRRSHDGEVITSKILMSHWLMHQSVNIHIVSWANLRPVCIKEAPNLVACVNRGHFVVSCEEVWAGGKWFHCGWFVLFCWKSHLLQYKTTVNPSCGSVDVGSSQYMWMLSSTAHTHTYGRSYVYALHSIRCQNAAGEIDGSAAALLLRPTCWNESSEDFFSPRGGHRSMKAIWNIVNRQAAPGQTTI